MERLSSAVAGGEFGHRARLWGLGFGNWVLRFGIWGSRVWGKGLGELRPQKSQSGAPER